MWSRAAIFPLDDNAASSCLLRGRGAMRADEKTVRQETDIWRDPVTALMKASCMPSALPPPARSDYDMP